MDSQIIPSAHSVILQLLKLQFLVLYPAVVAFSDCLIEAIKSIL